jgi:hypothetical protein
MIGNRRGAEGREGTGEEQREEGEYVRSRGKIVNR